MKKNLTIVIDNILKNYESHYKQQIDQSDIYFSFLNNQLKTHPEYEQNLNFQHQNRKSKFYIFREYLKHLTLIFSYLHRDRKIGCDVYSDKKVLIDDDDKLVYLQQKGNEPSAWMDYKYFEAYKNIIKCKRFAKMNHCSDIGLTFTQIIDDVAKDPVIISLWGRKITYDEDIKVFRKRGQNPFKDII